MTGNEDQLKRERFREEENECAKKKVENKQRAELEKEPTRGEALTTLIH
jgi:hypothetical protein